jgi:hypothetical protein
VAAARTGFQLLSGFAHVECPQPPPLVPPT